MVSCLWLSRYDAHKFQKDQIKKGPRAGTARRFRGNISQKRSASASGSKRHISMHSNLYGVGEKPPEDSLGEIGLIHKMPALLPL